jgi:hypothetical protein
MHKSIGIKWVSVAMLLGFAGLAHAEKAQAPQRKLIEVQKASISVVSEAEHKKEGHVVSGKVTWATGKNGSPTGNATEACSHVTVSAVETVENKTGIFTFDSQKVMVSTKGTPVDANDVKKGCNYRLTHVPAEKNLGFDASYGPGGDWNPKCNPPGQFVADNGEVAHLTLPKTGAQVTIDIAINNVYCANIQ